MKALIKCDFNDSFVKYHYLSVGVAVTVYLLKPGLHFFGTVPFEFGPGG